MNKRIVQSLWIGSDLSLMEQTSIKSFLAHGHEFHLYVYDSVANIPSGAQIIDAGSILPKSDIFTYQADRHKGSFAGFANLFRYKLLATKGNIWSDTDVICLKPFDFDSYVFSSENMPDEGRLVPTCTVMAAPQGPSRFFDFCYTIAAKMDPRRLKIRENGALLIDKLIPAFNLKQYIVQQKVFSPIGWWEWEKLITASVSTLPDCLAVHLWHEMWRISGTEKNKRYPTNTIYGYLQELLD